MSLSTELLKNAKELKTFLSIWVYSDDEKFWFGQVIDYNTELILFQHYTKYGVNDGIIVINISEVISIDFEDDYSKAMQVVIENSKELAKESEYKFEYFAKENWRKDILDQLATNQKIISSVEINNTYYSGFIIEVDNHNFIINCIGSLGENEGKVLYKIEDVTGFKLIDIENRKRLLLYNWRKKIRN